MDDLCSWQTSVRLTARQEFALDDLVNTGFAPNRSQVLRKLIDTALDAVKYEHIEVLPCRG